MPSVLKMAPEKMRLREKGGGGGETEKVGEWGREAERAADEGRVENRKGTEQTDTEKGEVEGNGGNRQLEEMLMHRPVGRTLGTGLEVATHLEEHLAPRRPESWVTLSMWLNLSELLLVPHMDIRVCDATVSLA